MRRLDDMATAPTAAVRPIDYTGSGLDPKLASGGNPYVQGNTAGNGAVAPTSPATISTPQKGAVASPYAVVSSGPATSNLNNITQDYNTNIKPTIDTANTNKAANSQLPVISGYNVSANPTGNQGEVKATNPSTGGSYYVTPQDQKTGPTADDVKNILTGGAPTTPTPQTPSDIAQTQTGTNPIKENSSYQEKLSGLSDQLTAAYTQFNNVIQTVQSGSFPLTGAQQSLVDATNAAFKQMSDQANLKAAALSSETGGVSTKINAMAGQLTNITSEQAAAIAKLEIGFQETDYKLISQSYQTFKDLETSKMTALKDGHDAVMTAYNSAVTAAQAQQTFNETVLRDTQNQYEFRDLKDSFGNTVGTQVFDKRTGSVVHQVNNGSGISDPATNTLGVVSTDGNGAPDALQQKAFLQTIPTAYQEMIKGIAEGRIAPPRTGTTKGNQILSWVTRYDPSLADGSGGFDATKFAARQAYQKNLASGTLSQGVVSANKAIQHLDAFNQAVSDLKNGPISSTINSLGKAIEQPLAGVFNPPKQGRMNIQGISSKADTERNGLQDEMAKFFKGTGSSDVESIKSWGGTLDPNATPGAQQGMVQGALTLYSGQMNSLISQYKSTMGKDPDLGQILQPETLKTLSGFKDAGYGVDIPGVYYTNKDSYLAGGGSQQALSAAYTHLQSLGIPTTPENVLHAAQIMNE